MVAIAGATSVQVPLDADSRHDLEAMLAAITDRTRLVLVCTPNNPTGPVVHADELDAFLDRVPVGRAGRHRRGLPRVRHRPGGPRRHRDVPAAAQRRGAAHLLARPTGWPGCGSATPWRTSPSRRRCARPRCRSASATSPRQAAIASLDAYDELQERVDALVAERARVVAALRAQGWAVPQTEANFVWLPLGDRTLDFAAAADEAGLVVRPFAGEGVRCTIAETAANDLLVEVAGRFRAARPGVSSRSSEYAKLTSHTGPFVVPQIDTSAGGGDSGHMPTAPPEDDASERALRASTVGPTLSFALLGLVTVLAVGLLGLSQQASVARDRDLAGTALAGPRLGALDSSASDRAASHGPAGAGAPRRHGPPRPPGSRRASGRSGRRRRSASAAAAASPPTCRATATSSGTPQLRPSRRRPARRPRRRSRPRRSRRPRSRPRRSPRPRSRPRRSRRRKKPRREEARGEEAGREEAGGQEAGREEAGSRREDSRRQARLAAGREQPAATTAGRRTRRAQARAPRRPSRRASTARSTATTTARQHGAEARPLAPG